MFTRAQVLQEQAKQEARSNRAAFDAMFGRDEAFYQIAALNRQATAHGDAGRHAEAVACLRRVNELNKETIRATPTEGLRLALYLQKAGHGTEAIAEVHKLIALVPAAMHAVLTNGKPSSADVKAGFEAEQYSVLYDKLRLIFQREKRQAEYDACKQLAQQWLARSAALYQRRVMHSEVAVPARPVR